MVLLVSHPIQAFGLAAAPEDRVGVARLGVDRARHPVAAGEVELARVTVGLALLTCGLRAHPAQRPVADGGLGTVVPAPFAAASLAAALTTALALSVDVREVHIRELVSFGDVFLRFRSWQQQLN